MLYVNNQPELQKLAKQYLKNWKLFVLSLVGCMALAGAFLLIKNKQWNTLTTVYIDESGGGSMASMAAKAAGFSDILGLGGGAVDNEIVIMQSHTVIRDAVRELGINVSYTNRPKIKRKVYFRDEPILLTSDNPTMGDTLRHALKFKIKVSADGKRAEVYGKDEERDVFVDTTVDLPAHFETGYGGFTLQTTPFFEEGEKLSIKIDYISYTAAAQGLMEDLEFDLVEKKANIIYIGLKHINPYLATTLLDAIVRNYETYSLEAKNLSTEYNITYLQRRIDTLSQELGELEYAIEAYKQGNKLSDLEAEMEVAVKEAQTIREQQLAVETQYEIIRQLEEYVKNPANDYSPIPLALGIDSKDAVTSLTQYNTLLSEYLRLSQTTAENNPSRELLEKQIKLAHDGVIVTIQAVRHGIEFTRQQVQAQMSQFEDRIKNMPRQEREFIQLKRDQELKQRIYVMLLAQQEQNFVMLSSDAPKAQLVDKAYCQVLPAGPNAKLILAAAFIFALFLPMAWLKVRDVSKKTLSDVSDIQGIDGLGPTHVMQGSDEDARRVRSSVIDALDHAGGKVVAVISMQPGEGKTATAQMLAESLRKTQRTVLEIASDQYDADTLESQAFKEDLARSAATYDVVIIDTPAFTLAPNALPVLKLSDVQVLVTRKDLTQKQNLAYAETLREMELLSHPVTLFFE